MKFSGKIKEGRLTLDYPDAFRAEVSQFDGLSVWIEVREQKRKRSNEQNSYYWSVIIPAFLEIFNKADLKFDSEKTHDILKTRFLLTKDPYTRVKSTTELTPDQFNEFIMGLQAWAATDFNYYIPDPNEDKKAGFMDNVS